MCENENNNLSRYLFGRNGLSNYKTANMLSKQIVNKFVCLNISKSFQEKYWQFFFRFCNLCTITHFQKSVLIKQRVNPLNFEKIIVVVLRKVYFYLKAS